ncbi:hypothetical protein DMENIID0001_042450 [Sergentomyia squamirostris]
MKSGLNELEPHRIFNCDETAVFLCPKAEECLTETDVRSIRNIKHRYPMLDIPVDSTSLVFYPPIPNCDLVIDNKNPSYFSLLQDAGASDIKIFTDGSVQNGNSEE